MLSPQKQYKTKTKLSKLNRHFIILRTSHTDVACKKSVLRYFAKLTGKHLCQSLYFTKVAGLKSHCRIEKLYQNDLSCQQSSGIIQLTAVCKTYKLS